VRFYRLHSNPEAPCFCPDHAWSGLWGGEWAADGSASRCGACDGSGEADLSATDCRVCDGTGWEPAQPGYSCCRSAAELLRYVDAHVGQVPDTRPVVAVFQGQQVGVGFDGEPLAVPTGAVQWITWAELAALAKETDE